MDGKKAAPTFFWSAVVVLIHGMTALACLALLAMTSVTCLDILLRLGGWPQKGAYDVIRITGALVIACALPVTTALKGHVAIEYFFHRMSRPWRAYVDALMRVLMILGFAAAMVGCYRYGLRLLKSGDVSPTLEIPLFWIPWVIALACGVTLLTVVFHLVHPTKELMKQ